MTSQKDNQEKTAKGILYFSDQAAAEQQPRNPRDREDPQIPIKQRNCSLKTWESARNGPAHKKQKGLPSRNKLFFARNMNK
jgi:hypothetical protein